MKFIKHRFYNSNGNLISSTIRNANEYYINIIDDDKVSITTNGTDIIYYRLGLAIENSEGKSFYMENPNHKWFIIVFTNDYIKITSTKETKPVTIKHYFTH